MDHEIHSPHVSRDFRLFVILVVGVGVVSVELVKPDEEVSSDRFGVEAGVFPGDGGFLSRELMILFNLTPFLNSSIRREHL